MSENATVTDVTGEAAARDAEYQEYLRVKAEQGPVETKPVTDSELLKQIQKLQARFDSLAAAQGVPSDPIGAAHQNLIAHVKARKDANPDFDIKALEDVLNGWDEHQDVDAVRDEIDDTIERSGPRVHDFVYLRELGRNLARAIRDEKDAA